MIKKRVAFYTLGCKLNFAETSTIARQFEEKGYQRVEFNEEADVYIVNSCSVTQQADRKCRAAIRKAIRTSPDAFMAVAGCYAQLKSKEISNIQGVDAILGSQEKFRMFQLFDDFEKKNEIEILASPIKRAEKFEPSYSLSDRTRSFLKIQDGCDYYCSFCTIPFARGKSRNASITETVKKAEEIAVNGVREVVLTGVNIGDFGQGGEEDFYNLTQALENVEGIERYRISSIEPNLLSDTIIEFVSKSSKFLPHLHIPLQSGSDTILKQMKRKYDTALFARRVRKIKELMPNAGIGVDVIVGFPGETEETFQTTYNFLKDLDISYLHVFSYSERENTRSVKMELKVSPKNIEERSKRLHLLSERKRIEFAHRNIGLEHEVLFEGKDDGGQISGWTENYIKYICRKDDITPGSIHRVKITGCTTEGILSGSLLKG
jgi:threonylcarbamoyladenosine tRNA methylthiotransferase MtaB